VSEVVAAYRTGHGGSCVPTKYVSYIPPLDAQTRQIYHTVHKSNKAPKCGCVILHHSIDGCKEIAHALNIAKVLVVFVVC
jgi:hypothetical protein